MHDEVLLQRKLQMNFMNSGLVLEPILNQFWTNFPANTNIYGHLQKYGKIGEYRKAGLYKDMDMYVDRYIYVPDDEKHWEIECPFYAGLRDF